MATTTVNVEELIREIEVAKQFVVQQEMYKQKLASDLYKAARNAKLWNIARKLGKSKPKSHGSWRILVFNWKGRNVKLVLDTFNGYLEILLDGERVALGNDEATFHQYMTSNLELAEEALEVLRGIEGSLAPKLVELADDIYVQKAGLRGRVEEALRQVLGVEADGDA